MKIITMVDVAMMGAVVDFKVAIFILCVVLGLAGHPFWAIFLYILLTDGI